MRVLTLFGTRPEVIKLAPVIAALEQRPSDFSTVNVASGQHLHLVDPFARELGVRIDHALGVGDGARTPLDVLHRGIDALSALALRVAPGALLVQGDTTTALAGALVGSYLRIPVGHVEAGLRSGSIDSPFPEELNRRLITLAARHHFAATPENRAALVAEGVDPACVVVTGNPVVDAVQQILRNGAPTERVRSLLAALRERKLLLLSTHRRESFGDVMASRLRVLGEFVARHEDVALVFPVHPNPEVRRSAARFLAEQPRVHLIDPLGYADFVHLMRAAWLIVSDSGGVQEEAPSVGRPLLVIRDRTERPEVLRAGFARLVGESADALRGMLEEAVESLAWFERARAGENPFGRGDAGPRIADALLAFSQAAR
ncbi:MAG TPA: UDP-N-acetylglucosamine 2-epimerase (non-hydrolyzing) [Myxococcota bacterium]|nr:UDP-N-acetylglucosamine 2-epimerase (non-hydrolyzing) [Myxococcota bacterium]